ncbi:carbon-monoxide dehydrogenase, catalytic subunit [Calderihabitans maritimus]|uniref:Carbon monoxide dehydrogenase n=2 Tax=Calderihabitans maritimus TaxID=1246530 RepID=A0A1Z5HRZ8_9FIRM|nr:carbon-monoxide dehydrogenase, catalytic subunit [Calderihabitans maritimus]
MIKAGTSNNWGGMKMSLDKKTIDRAARQMLERTRADGVKTVWDRLEAQQPQCGFGLLGICCRNCLQGPCRINPFGEPSRGVCGADADTIVARNLLRSVAGGTSAHVDHAYEVVEALDKIAKGQIDYQIQDEHKLKAIATKLGLETDQKDITTLAGEVAEKAFESFTNHTSETMGWLAAWAPQERIDTWGKLGVLPRNADREIREAMHQTTMGVDADPINLLLATVKQGLVDGFAGLKLATDIQDIIFGTPQPVKAETNLGVLKADHVNVVVHGHVPLLSEKIVEWCRRLEEEAKAAGAAGINVAGICCTGNEVLMRQGVPPATNFLGQELALATGAVDLMVVDAQCIMPSLINVAQCYHGEIVTTMPISKIPGAHHVPFTLEEADQQAREIVRRAINSFKKRDMNRVQIPEEKVPIVAGFSVEAIIGALAKINAEDPLKPLVESIKNGAILGAVGTVGCNNVKFTQDLVHVELVKQLIANDVLVVATGCSAHALGKAGLLHPDATKNVAGPGLRQVLTAVGEAAGLGEPLPPVLHMGSCVDNSRIGDLLIALADYLGVAVKDLPVAASAPEPQHEKALSIGTWAVAMGILTHVGLPPHVLGSATVSGALTGQPVESLLGGKFYVEADPVKAAEGLINHLKSKRKALGL